MATNQIHILIALVAAIIFVQVTYAVGQQQQQEPAKRDTSGYRAKLISETEVAPGNGDPNGVCSEMRNERICSACCNNNLYETFIFYGNQCCCVQNDLETHKMAENQLVDLKKLFAMAGLKT